MLNSNYLFNVFYSHFRYSGIIPIYQMNDLRENMSVMDNYPNPSSTISYTFFKCQNIGVELQGIIGISYCID